MPSLDYKSLNLWFSKAKRHFPWRQSPSPYHVWISEVMLQQTRASVVVEYFLRWMERFPSIASLASATSEQVIKAWEGLGYYSRARNLHATAKILVENFDGNLPSNEQELLKLPGIGNYTVGAIRCFAFHQKAAAVDGNVLRVLTRYFSIQEDIAKAVVQQRIRQLTLEILPDSDPWHTMEALIELGATVCSPIPQCHLCPMASSCSSSHRPEAAMLPVKSGKLKATALYRLVLIPYFEGAVGVQLRSHGEIMADLYEFPYLPCNAVKPEVEEALAAANTMWGTARYVMDLKAEKQLFTRYRVQLFPVVIALKTAVASLRWQAVEALSQLPFSSGHRRIAASLRSVVFTQLEVFIEGSVSIVDGDDKALVAP